MNVPSQCWKVQLEYPVLRRGQSLMPSLAVGLPSISVSSPVVQAWMMRSLTNCVSMESSSGITRDPDGIDSGSKSEGGNELSKVRIRLAVRFRVRGCGVGEGEGEGDEECGETTTAGESMTWVSSKGCVPWICSSENLAPCAWRWCG